MPSALDRVREVAQKDREAKFTALLHHVDVERLAVAYYGERQIPRCNMSVTVRVCVRGIMLM